MSWLPALVAAPPGGQYHTALEHEGRAVLFSHDDLTAYVLDGVHWRRLIGGRPSAFHPAPWHVNVALGNDALWVLADELWCARGQGALEAVARQERGPGSHFAHRTALVWDVRRPRLLVISGEASGEIWAFEDGHWRQLPSGPPRGYAAAVATDEGVYVASGRELWLLRDEEWLLLASEATWPAGQKRAHGVAHVLFCHRGALVAVGALKSGGTEVSALRQEDPAWRSLAQLPDLPSLSGGFLDRGWYPATLLHDLAGERLLLFCRADHSGPLQGPLALGLSSAGELPTTPRRSAARRRARAPKHLVRSAWAIRASDGEPPPPVGGPSGWRVCAMLASDPTSLPLKDHAGLAILVEEPHGLAVQHLVLPIPPVAAIYPYGEPARRVELVPFEEVDPRQDTDFTVDAGPGNPQGSKLGGFPFDDPNQPCPDCGAARKLAIRLSTDLFPELGDGAIEIYQCPQGHLSSALYLS